MSSRESASMLTTVHIENHALTGQIEIRQTPDRVFQSLIDPDQGIRWWGSPDTYTVTGFYLERAVGGRWRLQALSWAHEAFEISGQVVEFDPPRVLAYTWNPSWRAIPTTVVRFELEPTRTGTRLHFRHSGFARDNAGLETHHYGWPLVLGWLNRHLKSGTKVLRPSGPGDALGDQVLYYAVD